MKKTYLYWLLSAIILGACNPYAHITKMKSMKEDLQYKFPVKYAELSNDLEIAYVDQGEGEDVLLFIHGLGSYIPSWQHEIDILSKKYRCIAIDLPGFGKSDKPNHSGMMSYYATVVKEFVDHLQLSNYTLVGHSMGGQISMTYSLMYPEHAKAMVLIAPAGIEGFTDGQKGWFEDVMTPRLVRLTNTDAIETNLAYNFYDFPADARFMVEDRIAMRTASDFPNYCLAVSRSVKGMLTEPVIDKLGGISLPTLMIFGEQDNLIPNRYLNPGTTKEVALFGASMIPNCKMVLIDKAGHFVGYEKATEVAAEITSFIQVTSKKQTL
ncbi:alpha/beta hydrolase [Algivirga pacifica]|uniref:Alpha/beta hydrolase n=1 Tax=Algivirga pacifica TaxID=1162670 RepID=A0ABP9DH75_9BACT